MRAQRLKTRTQPCKEGVKRLRWLKVGDVCLNLEEVQVMFIGETAMGRFVLVAHLRNGQTVALGDYADRSTASAVLAEIMRQLGETLSDSLVELPEVR
jgi:hypothetical protein